MTRNDAHDDLPEVGPLLDEACAVLDPKDDIEAVGEPAYARGIRYGTGFVQGMLDGLRVGRAFDDLASTSLRRGSSGVVGLRFPMWLPLEPDARGRLVGTLAQSNEASEHVETEGPASEPVCHIAIGYASGWTSALRGETWLARESGCIACGQAHCRFELMRVSDWIEHDEDWAREVVPFLDLERVEEQLCGDPDDFEEAGFADGPASGPSMEGLSPAIHVWGPVAVLPYSGARDGESAIDPVLRDPETEEIRVVVVDVLGARLDGIEASGLPRVVHALRERDLEVIVAGRHQTRGEPSASASDVLEAPDLPTAIALAFQLLNFT